MADFTTTITDAGVLDADEVTIYATQLQLAATPLLVADQAVTVQQSGAAKVFQFAKYDALSVPSALSDGVDPASVALADSVVTLTPVEEGNVITLALLADLESGMKARQAASILIGNNAGETAEQRAITALDGAATNIIYPNGHTAATTLTENDVLDSVFAGRLYNKLRRSNIPGINGSYIGIAHEDCLYDLRADAGNNGWTDVSKYANPDSVLRNEVGMFQGIRWLNSGKATVTTDGGAASVDEYELHVVGFNALGYCSSAPIQLKVTGPFDKLGRFINFGWMGIFIYDTIQDANMVSGHVASSIGANT